MKYIPKGSMCMSCVKKHDNCTKLPFSKMSVIAQFPHLTIVRCSSYKREKKVEDL